VDAANASGKLSWRRLKSRGYFASPRPSFDELRMTKEREMPRNQARRVKAVFT